MKSNFRQCDGLALAVLFQRFACSWFIFKFEPSVRESQESHSINLNLDPVNFWQKLFKLWHWLLQFYIENKMRALTDSKLNIFLDKTKKRIMEFRLKSILSKFQPFSILEKFISLKSQPNAYDSIFNLRKVRYSTSFLIWMFQVVTKLKAE